MDTAMLASWVQETVAQILQGNAQTEAGDRLRLSDQRATEAAQEVIEELHSKAQDLDQYPFQTDRCGVRFYFELEEGVYPGPGIITAWTWDEDQWRPIGSIELE